MHLMYILLSVVTVQIIEGKLSFLKFNIHDIVDVSAILRTIKILYNINEKSHKNKIIIVKLTL